MASIVCLKFSDLQYDHGHLKLPFTPHRPDKVRSGTGFIYKELLITAVFCFVIPTECRNEWRNPLQSTS